MEERNLIQLARPSSTTTLSKSHCSTFSLPSNGIIVLNGTDAITLTADAIFKPECLANSDQILTGSGTTSYSDLRDPFYASTIPECYALAATTMIAYMLVIMLLITPRTFLHEGAVVLGKRGFTNGPSGSDAGIGIGGRPWLQKVAALTVAISLTIATVDTLRVAERQYLIGIMDAQALQSEVENGTELKVIRVISDTFLWLAQAQTLIRLFPRQREKIIIKWTAFALITLDVLFSILNNFVYEGSSRPSSFKDAVPALAYLFQLALSLLYAAWVVYYSITKKAFAFYHPQMKNICLVALLSLLAVLVPVVFFVLDISKPRLAGWGDYVRWVGAAAASVVVWEWVERIEALERDDKKDGVLGREIFDGDEMLEVSSDPDIVHYMKHSRNDRTGKRDGGGDSLSTSSNKIWPGMAGLANRYRFHATHDVESGAAGAPKSAHIISTRTSRGRPPLWPTRPPPAATPISRTDTASAESTVYAVRYHPISDATTPMQERTTPDNVRPQSLEISAEPSVEDTSKNDLESPVAIEPMEQESTPPNPSNAWRSLVKANPFKRRAQGLPLEVSASRLAPQPIDPRDASDKWDVRARLEGFAALQADRLRERSKPNVTTGPLPITVIPAPARRRNLAAAIEDLHHAERAETHARRGATYQAPTTSSDEPLIPQEADEDSPTQRQRAADNYTPNNLNGHLILQQGAISFVAASPSHRDGSNAATPRSPVSSTDFREQSTPVSTRSRHSQPRSPTAGRNDILPVVSIPAPPRRPRTPEE